MAQYGRSTERPIVRMGRRRHCNRRDSGVSRGDGCERKNGAQRSFGANAIARSDDRATPPECDDAMYGRSTERPVVRMAMATIMAAPPNPPLKGAGFAVVDITLLPFRGGREGLSNRPRACRRQDAPWCVRTCVDVDDRATTTYGLRRPNPISSASR
jgi:hypothetical protein